MTPSTSNTAPATSRATRADDAAFTNDDFERLLGVCRAMGDGLPAEDVLERVLTEARRFTRAEAGSVYTVENNRLRLVCCQNDARPDLAMHATNGGSACLIRGLRGRTFPIDESSLAGKAAHTQALVRVDAEEGDSVVDAANARSTTDAATGYRCASMLVAPLLDARGSVVGVLQIINRLDDEGVVATFTKRDERVLTALASIAAPSVREAQVRESIERSQLDTILRLATAAEFRDTETSDHLRRVALYCETIARALGRPQEWSRLLLLASPMHDIGKLGVPDAVLLKPGKFTPDERAVMEKHTVIGSRILAEAKSDLLAMAERIARWHHERWDGKGYPDELRGEDIPLEARIVAVADVFDALTSRRVYKEAFGVDDSFREIAEGRGSRFDPAIVDAFLKVRSEILSVYEAFSPQSEAAHVGTPIPGH